MPPSTGRRDPADDKHLRKFPYRGTAGESVETLLHVPDWSATWDQRHLDACVGFAACMCMSVLNETDAVAQKSPPYKRLYDAPQLWWQARLTDEFPDNDDLSDPTQGTTMRAGLEVLRTTGPKLVVRGVTQAPDVAEGISEYRWGMTLDHLRHAIGVTKTPVLLGMDAWQGMAHPVKFAGELWVGDGVPDWQAGLFLGGHAYCALGVSDHRGAVLLQNSWRLPPYWVKYEVVEKEIKSGRVEMGIITDRPSP